MIETMTRRKALALMGALSASALALSACSEDKAEAQTASGQATSSSTAAAPRPSGTVDMDKLLAEGALPEKVLGQADAPVTIVEYASMTCGHCGNFHNNTLPTIKEKYIDTGKARLIMREFPFDPRAEAGFMLARCADDKYFAMIEVLFKQQSNWVSVENAQQALLNIAKLAGFTQESFEACLTDQKLLDDVRAVRSRGANDFDVDSTPTFFINGNKYTGALSVDEMSAIIDGLV
ncbi:MAG: DsbA family protein [Rhizobiaceae bacterium]|nr:DsbA family protein [Rhizobiaceae bacterium]MCV0405672.1 DsbA family protein [Rhizobiaceae bacterium]